MGRTSMDSVGGGGGAGPLGAASEPWELPGGLTTGVSVGSSMMSDTTTKELAMLDAGGAPPGSRGTSTIELLRLCAGGPTEGSGVSRRWHVASGTVGRGFVGTSIRGESPRPKVVGWATTGASWSTAEGAFHVGDEDIGELTVGMWYWVPP